MADADVAITAGTGTKVDTRTVGAGTDEHRQVIVVGDPTTAANVASADATNGLDVDVTRVQGTVTVDSELPTAAALSDTIANPTSPMVGAGGMVYNGTDWRRARQANLADNTATTGIPAVQMNIVSSAGTDLNPVRAANGFGDASGMNTGLPVVQWAYNGASFDRVRGDATNGLDVDVTRLPKAATATTSQVADTASSATILAANAGRLGATITNDSSARLYVRLGAAVASTTNYSFSLAQHETWEPTDSVIFTGEIRGIWATDPGDGGAKVTELT